MTRRTLARRLRSCASQERGFTIVETVVAMVVIFGSLTALAYTATIGFRYISYGRDRQQATGYANKIMEEIRGQAYSTIQQGLASTDLTGDSRIVNCSGTYRFESCSGTKIVSSVVPTGTTAQWIIPHRGTTTVGNLPISWATYVTNENIVNNPYTVTVIVSWSGGAINGAPNNLVRLESKFYSPTGCVSSSTHPFAAPCQPYFYGLAEVPAGSITIRGQLHDFFVDFERATMGFPEARALVQQEQVTSVRADAAESTLTMSDSAGLEEGAGATVAASADTDPSSPDDVTAGLTLTGPGDSVERHQTDFWPAEEIGLQLDVPAGQTGNANVSTSASAADTYACPPSGTREADSLPCAGAFVRQVNTVSAAVPMDHAVASLGAAKLIRITQPGSSSIATAERDAVTDDDGLVDVQATRYLGDVYLGGFPTAGMSAPTNMSATDTDAANYCMSLTGYNDTARVYAGERTSTGPAASVTAGTFTYWNSGTSSFVSLDATSSSLDTLAFSCTKSQIVDGHNVSWTVTVVPGDIVHAKVPAFIDDTDAVDSQIKLESEATVQAIEITFNYEVIVDSVPEVDLDVTVDPGTLITRGVYGPPPSAG